VKIDDCQRLTGKHFWEIEMNQDPPLWRAYIDAVKHFGIDGWFIYGGLEELSYTYQELGKSILEVSSSITPPPTTSECMCR
jgi:hypothetical protein